MTARTEDIWLITGASSGLGRAIALAAADRGQLVVATARNVSSIEDLARENLKTLELDVTKPASKLAVEAAGLYGRLPSVIISNAGSATLGTAEETTDAELRAQFDANLFGLVEVARQFLPALRNYGTRGWMVNVSCAASYRSAPAFSSYDASKQALSAWTRSLRAELEPYGVNVVSVEPGLLATGLFDSTSVARPAPYVKARRLAAADPYHLLHDDIGRIISSHLDDAADASKCAERIVDMVLGTGLSAGRKPPAELVLGKDAVALVRESLERKLRELSENEDISNSIG